MGGSWGSTSGMDTNWNILGNDIFNTNTGAVQISQTTLPANPIDATKIYSKDVAGTSQLFALNEAGLEVQLTGLSTLSDEFRMVFRFSSLFEASRTDIEIFEDGGIFQRIPLRFAGSLTKSMAKVTSPRTAGTLTFEITLNGTKTLDTDLNLVIDVTNPSVVADSANLGVVPFIATEDVGIKVTSDASWAPDIDFEFALYGVFS